MVDPAQHGPGATSHAADERGNAALAAQLTADATTGRRGHVNKIALAIGGNLTPPIAALAMAPILARAFGVVGRGQIAAGTAPFLLAATLATLGLPEAVTYGASRRPELLASLVRRASVVALMAGAAAAVVTVLLASVASGHEQHTARLIVVVAPMIPLALLVAVLRAAAGSQGQWGLVAAEQVLSAVVRLAVLVVLLATDHLTLLGAALLTAAAPVLGGVVYVRLRKDKAHGGRSPQTSDDRFGHMLRYAGRIWIGSLFGIVLLRLDQALMAPLSSAYQLGLYAVAVNISEVPLIINLAVRDVTFAAQSRENVDEQVVVAARSTLIASTAFAALIALPMPWWVPFVFGDGFKASIIPAVILLIAVAGGTPGSLAGAGLSARGMPGRRSLSLAFAAVVNAGLIFALVPHFGADGAAVATLVGNLVASHGNIVFLARNGGPRAGEYYRVGARDVAGLARELRQLARSRGRLAAKD